MKSSTHLYLKLLLPLFLLIPFYFILPTSVLLIMFLIGLYLGIVLLLADEKWMHSYYSDAETVVAVKQGFQPRLITRSLLFTLILVPLSLFVVTSTDSVVGWGVILGIWTTLLIEMWSLRNFPQRFHDWFLFDLKRTIKAEEIDYMVLGGTGLFALWIIMLVF